MPSPAIRSFAPSMRRRAHPVQLGVAVGAQPARRAAQDFLGRALRRRRGAGARQRGASPSSFAPRRGRELDERSLRTKVGSIDATRPRRDEQRRLSRAAGDLERSVRIDGQRGLVAEHRHREGLGQGGIERAGRERLLRMVAAGDVPAAHGHAVLGDRARLVHADDGRGSEALHRGEAPHEHASLEHLSHAERQGRRRHRRQPFRHRGDGEGRGRPEDRQRGEASQDRRRGTGRRTVPARRTRAGGPPGRAGARAACAALAPRSPARGCGPAPCAGRSP